MTFENNKSNFENNIFDELYDIVDSLHVKKVREYKGWSDFFKCYFEAYIAYTKLCDKIGMLTTSNSLGNFFRRYNYHLWIDMLGPIISIKELLRCMKPSKRTKEDCDYIVYYDNGVITQNGIVLYPEGGQIPNDAISCFRSIDDYESRYFSTHEFIEYYNKKENKSSLEPMLDELLDFLCFKNYNILDNVESEDCEDIEEVYPYLVDSAVEQYNQQAAYDTKRIAAYADICKDHTINETPSKAWERLFLRDIQVLKRLMDHTIKEIDSATRSLYYDRYDLQFIQENCFVAEFLYDIYTDKSLFLYECKKIGSNSLFFDAMQDLSEDNYDTLFYWIHRCNLIKAERDAGASKMKQYVEFIRNGKAERGIDIINHMVGNDTNDEDILEILMKEKENSISFGRNGIMATQDEAQMMEDNKNIQSQPQVIIAYGLNNIGCDQTGASFQTIVPEAESVKEEDTSDNSANSTSEQSKDEVVQEELCHFIYPGLDEKEAQQVHRQIKDLVKRFPMKDICSFLNRLADENKILQPQIPQNAFEELHRMGMPPQDTKGFGYDNFCKYYRK